MTYPKHAPKCESFKRIFNGFFGVHNCLEHMVLRSQNRKYEKPKHGDMLKHCGQIL